MKKVAVFAVKGGVGKSTVSAGLCQGIRDHGFKNRVGYLEIDISGTSGHRAFGIEPPRLQLDTEREKLIPPIIDGIRIFPLASKFTESACVGWQSEDKIRTLSNGDKVIDKGRTGFIADILTKVVDWQDTEWLVLDLPPSTSEETFTFFDCIPDLYGVVLVSQPSEIACVGLLKTIDFLRTTERPVLGIVENMASCLCPRCGATFYPFTSKGMDLRKIAGEQGIPFLASLPQVDNMAKLQPYFYDLAGKIMSKHGKVISQDVVSRSSRMKRWAEEKILDLTSRIARRS
jgi:ATP-binding protein involved in chromosome partitioning